MKHTPHSFFRGVLTGLALAATLIGAGGGSRRVAVAQEDTGVIRVDGAVGNDVDDCGSEAAPCRTIQYAISESDAGDTILVAEGTYTYDPATAANCFDSGTGITTAVVCVTTHSLTLLGGYASGNWSLSDPALYPTLIDGENAYRGVLAQNVTLRLEGFTIQNGLAKGSNIGSTYDVNTNAYGGGLQSTSTALTLRNMIFKDNRAKGGDLNAEIGAGGIGGGLSMNNYQPANTYNLVENVVFEGNIAEGGRGSSRGGNGIGGGLHLYKVTVNFKNVTFRNNIARSGPTNGSGMVGWGYADAQGGAAAIYFYSQATFEGITAIENQALGGDAPNGSGGGSFGGALYYEHAVDPSITDGLFRGNLAEGGSGAGTGGLAEGGAIQTDGSNIALDRVSVIANIARSGDGSVKGSAGGGGLALTRMTSDGVTPDPGGNISIVNCVIADNRVEQGAGSPGNSGGGGGGLWLQGTLGTVSHTTFARNYAASGLIGQGVILIATPIPSVNNLDYVIFADHIANGAADAALYVQQGATVNLNQGLWSGNSKDTNVAGYQPGTFNGLSTMRSGVADFVLPGTPHYDYHIKGTSAARNQATTSSQAVDLDLDSRLLFPPADIGADEYLPIVLTVTPFAARQLRLSWKPDTGLAATTHHYTIAFTKESGAVNPAEGASPINAGTATSLVLTGLTSSKQYIFTIQARNASNTVLDSSNNVAAAPADRFVFLPMICR